MIKFIRHFITFPYVWFFFLLLLVAAKLAMEGYWGYAKGTGCAAAILILVILLCKPMNAVYGLMGAAGDIRTFFQLFLGITFLFAGVYQMGFFQHAGITYDVNQPHIDYDLYKFQERKPTTVNRPSLRDTITYERIIDSTLVREEVVKISHESLNYQPINFWFTLRNTIMTSLMQEPTDFFAIASTHNSSMEIEEPTLSKDEVSGSKLDNQKSELFQTVLIFQVLISWVFFGVFISLLYNKFRYES